MKFRLLVSVMFSTLLFAFSAWLFADTINDPGQDGPAYCLVLARDIIAPEGLDQPEQPVFGIQADQVAIASPIGAITSATPDNYGDYALFAADRKADDPSGESALKCSFAYTDAERALETTRDMAAYSVTVGRITITCSTVNCVLKCPL